MGRLQVRLALACLSCCGASWAGAQTTFSASELVERNERYWKAIRSVDVEFTQEGWAAGNRADLTPIPSADSIHWAMSAGRERLQFCEMAPADDDRVSFSPTRLIQHDFYYDGKTTFHLFGEDVGKKTPSSEIEGLQISMRGRVCAGLDDGFIDYHPAYHWLLMKRLMMRFGNPWRPDETLRTFVEDNETNRPVSHVDNNGDQLWLFRISPSAANTVAGSRAPYVDVVINESKGFLVQAIDHHSFDAPRTEHASEIVTELRIEEYAKVGEGLYFPNKVVQHIYNAAMRAETELSKIYTVRRLRVNADLADETFEFSIPAFVTVTHSPLVEREGETYEPISVWGSDNKPMRTFSEPGEYDAYLDKLLEEINGAKILP